MFHRLNRTVAARVVGGAALAALAGGGLATATPAHAATTVPDVLAKIRYCESGNNYSAVNASSGASGAYQFLDSTWRGLSAAAGYSTAASAPAAVQDAAAVELYNQQGTTPWVSSQSCWAALGAVPTTTATSATTTTNATNTATTATQTAAVERQAPATQTAPVAQQAPAQQAPASQQAAQRPGTSARGSQDRVAQQGAKPAQPALDADGDLAGHAGNAGAPRACR